MVAIPDWVISLIVSIAGSAVTVGIQLVRAKVMLEMLTAANKKLHSRVDDLNDVCSGLRQEVAIIKTLDSVRDNTPTPVDVQEMTGRHRLKKKDDT